MYYLLLAILSSTLVSVLMRFSQGHVKNTMALFLANYIVCSAIARSYMGAQALLPGQSGLAFALALGLAGGGLYLGSFWLMRLNIRKNGVMLTSVFMKLGVLVPIITAVVFFREMPGGFQLAGFSLAIAAIFILNYTPRSEKAGSRYLLPVLLVVGGFTDSLINFYDKLGASALKDHFLFYIFLSAAVISLFITLLQRKKLSCVDFLFGALIGIPNYYSSRFLMLSLRSVKAIVAYPIYNAGTIVLICAAGILLFREQLNRRKACGIFLILIALVLLKL